MDTNKIYSLLKKRCGKTFVGVFASDRLPGSLPPRRPLILVANTDPHTKNGEHWVCLYIDNHGEYFDSFGEMPSEIFHRYMDKFCSTWLKNSVKIQSVLSAMCGHHVVTYALMKMLGHSLHEIINMYTDDTAVNDMISHNFVCFGL